MRAECPEPGRLAAFTEGNVSAAERKAIVSHLAECDLCAEIVADTAAWIDHEAAEGVDGAESGAESVPAAQVQRGALRLAAGVAGAVLATAALLLVFRSDPAVDMVAANSVEPVAQAVVAGLTNPEQDVLRSLGPISTDRSVDNPGRRLRAFEAGRSDLRLAVQQLLESEAVETGSADSQIDDDRSAEREFRAFGVWLEANHLRCKTARVESRDTLVTEARRWRRELDRDRVKAAIDRFIEAVKQDGPICGEDGALEMLEGGVATALTV